VLGLGASAILLYGLALLYGLGGSTTLEDVARAIPRAGAGSALALALIVAGLSFKLGVVPLQRWLPVPHVHAAACTTQQNARHHTQLYTYKLNSKPTAAA